MSASLQQLHEQLAELERDKAQLGRDNRAQRAENEKLEHRLALLTKPLGEGKRWRWYSWLALCVGVLALGVGYGFYRGHRRQAALRSVSKPLPRIAHPRLLITSVPSGATVKINGEPVGKTPLLRPLQGRRRQRRLAVVVSSEGYRPRHADVSIAKHTGAHVHAALERCGPNDSDASCAIGRGAQRSPPDPRMRDRRYQKIQKIQIIRGLKKPTKDAPVPIHIELDADGKPIRRRD